MVANGLAPHVSDACRLASIAGLQEIVARGTVLLDDANLILHEYLGNLRVGGQPGVGDRFFKWLWDNQGYPDKCQKIEIHPIVDPKVFDEFPDDPELAAFDPADRKFVAVALASTLNPPILNSSDSDWWIFGEALARNGIDVRNLCPDLID